MSRTATYHATVNWTGGHCGHLAALDQRADLLLPGTAAERPAVDQHDRAAGAVVFVVEFDRIDFGGE